MNILRIDKNTITSQDPTFYYRLCLLKVLTLLFTFEYPIFYGVMWYNGFTEMGAFNSTVMLLSSLVIFLLIYFLVKGEKEYKFGSTMLLLSIGALITLSPYLNTNGWQSPSYYYYSPFLVFVFLLLGLKGMLASALILVILLSSQMLFPSPLSLSVLDEKLLEKLHEVYAVRIESLVLTTVFLIILEKITLIIRNALADEKEKAERIEKYETLTKVAEGFAHEINNPLAIASGHFNRLSSPCLEEDKHKKERIQQAHTRIGAVVSRFLALFSNENLPFTDLNLKKSVESSIELYFSSEDRVRIEIPDDLRLSSNIVIFGQVVKVITENALEASEGIPVVWKAEDKNTIICEDNGTGLSDMELREALKPFVTTKFNAHGRGLGLFAASLFAEKGKFEIFYERRGQKTIFGLRFSEAFTKEFSTVT